jgi:predicted HTH domain antitoxin
VLTASFLFGGEEEWNHERHENHERKQTVVVNNYTGECQILARAAQVARMTGNRYDSRLAMNHDFSQGRAALT